jgi:hypothetical protein
MRPREKELAHFGASITWVPQPTASSVYANAIRMTSKERYGLDERFFESIARLDVDDVDAEAASAWLGSRLLDDDVFVVFGREDVARISRSTFLRSWRDMFCPSRDDVVIMPETQDWCLFYWHEDEFEFGRTKRPNKAPEPTSGIVTSRAEPRAAPIPPVAHL